MCRLLQFLRNVSAARLLRPDVVWFGESIPTQALEQSFRALEMCDTLIVVGTSGAVYPVASFPETVKGNGGFVIEVNMEETPISRYSGHLALFGKSGEILPGSRGGFVAARRGVPRVFSRLALSSAGFARLDVHCGMLRCAQPLSSRNPVTVYLGKSLRLNIKLNRSRKRLATP